MFKCLKNSHKMLKNKIKLTCFTFIKSKKKLINKIKQKINDKSCIDTSSVKCYRITQVNLKKYILIKKRKHPKSSNS